jgi:hypothetical protein
LHGWLKTHFIVCLVTRICLDPIWIIMSSESNLSSNQLRNSLLSGDFAARCRIPLNHISYIAVHVDGVSVVDMNDLMIDGEH